MQIYMDEKTILCLFSLLMIVSLVNMFCTTICIVLISKHTEVMKENMTKESYKNEPIIIQNEQLENIIVKYIREICTRCIQSVFMTLGNNMYHQNENKYLNIQE